MTANKIHATASSKRTKSGSVSNLHINTIWIVACVLSYGYIIQIVIQVRKKKSVQIQFCQTNALWRLNPTYRVYSS